MPSPAASARQLSLPLMVLHRVRYTENHSLSGAQIATIPSMIWHPKLFCNTSAARCKLLFALFRNSETSLFESRTDFSAGASREGPADKIVMGGQAALEEELREEIGAAEELADAAAADDVAVGPLVDDAGRAVCEHLPLDAALARCCSLWLAVWHSSASGSKFKGSAPQCGHQRRRMPMKSRIRRYDDLTRLHDTTALKKDCHLPSFTFSPRPAQKSNDSTASQVIWRWLADPMTKMGRSNSDTMLQ